MTRQHKTSATSRERNRVHARKTRQRKKAQMESLQSKAEHLKKEQIQLKLSINEKNTASILCALFAKDKDDCPGEDPRIEALLRRSTDDIPDSSKLPALRPLILPSGAQHFKKNQTSTLTTDQAELPDDGIDYELLGKDRSKCSPAELDQIRKERNRMHAKRTRDRKRLFMEEMTEMCRALEEENTLLRHHLVSLSGGALSDQEPISSHTISPSLAPSSPPNAPTGFREVKPGRKRYLETTAVALKVDSASESKSATEPGELNSLVQAVGTTTRTYHPYSSGSSFSGDDDNSEAASLTYKRRYHSVSSEHAIPRSISTTAAGNLTSIGV